VTVRSALDLRVTRRALAGAVIIAPFAARSIVAAQVDGTPVARPERSAVEVIDLVAPAVVTVINEVRFDQRSGSIAQPVGSGTGFIIDDSGHLVTNNHVVAGGESFSVTLLDGTSRPAELIGGDHISDLAIVQIDGDLPGVVTFGDSDRLKPGQTVLAIGSPLSAFTNTVTQGVVSAIDRDFPGANTYTNLIQHDAAINPGNSGGPLFDLAGEVVGVNTLGIPQTESGPIQGLFFAIPSNAVARIASILIESRRVIYPFVGITYEAVTLTDRDGERRLGVLIRSVESGSPADAGGLRANDVIIEIDGAPISVTESFSELLFRHQPGETIEITVVRDGRRVNTDVTLIARPNGV